MGGGHNRASPGCTLARNAHRRACRRSNRLCLPEPRHERPPNSGGGRRAGIQRFLRLALSASPAASRSPPTAAEALKAFVSRAPGAVVDLGLPDRDGGDVLRHQGALAGAGRRPFGARPPTER